MSQINTNVTSLYALHKLAINQASLAVSFQRLSTGLRINSGADDPAGLIASQSLRSEITGINKALDNSQRAGNVIDTAEGALNEVSAMLLQITALNNQSANTGGLSVSEIQANQLQLDAILTSINRIANTTQFNGIHLLDGGLDFNTSGINGTAISGLLVNSAKLPENGGVEVAVQVTQSAKVGTITFAASGIGAAPTTIDIAGNLGSQHLSFAASTHNSAIALAIDQVRNTTGVSAVVQANGQLNLYATAFGSKNFVSVQAIDGTFANGRASGADAGVNINGSRADVDGTVASLRTSNLDLTVNLTAAFAQNTSTTGLTTFFITGGGARFQLGSVVNPNGQEQLGVGAVSTGSLGNADVGYLSSLATGGVNSQASGNTAQVQKIIDAVITQVSTLRGRLGAFQKDVLTSNSQSLSVALENITASESAIRDTNFAAETANLTREQILVQSGTSVLAQANSAPQNVLTLLQHA